MNIGLPHNHSSRRNQSGVSLLESLVALLILALGVLGMLGVQLKSLSDNQSATQRAIAVRLAEDLFERIKASPQGLGGINLTAYSVNGVWGSLPVPTIPTSQQCGADQPSNSSVACDAANQAAFDLLRWRTVVSQSLHGGNATTFISPSDPEQLGVMVSWRLRQTDSSTDSAANTERTSWFNVDVAGGPACPANALCLVAYGKP